MVYSKFRYPTNKSFSFTIFDDTDLSNLQNVQTVYKFISDLGFRTTKSVFTLESNKPHFKNNKSTTLQDKDYLNLILNLKKEGFEIASHLVWADSSDRKKTQKGFEEFKKLIGEYPKSLTNHLNNKDGIYFGDARVSGTIRLFYNLVTLLKNFKKFEGHNPDSKYFWADLCKEHIKYVRNFVYNDINTLKACPYMPYHDPSRSFVNYWFASSDGFDVKTFCDCISEENQDRLEAEGGACIIYTHFASGFEKNGVLNPRFKYLMERLSKKNGWFVPVSTLLDYLLEQKSNSIISDENRKKLELKWFKEKLFKGSN
jgi:hypothetical protein